MTERAHCYNSLNCNLLVDWKGGQDLTKIRRDAKLRKDRSIKGQEGC